MRYQTFYLFIVLSFVVTGPCLSQTNARVSKPELILENDKLIINYDITASQHDDIFRVWVEITDTNNNKINALALSGDIGEQVSGGKRKKISWDFIEDKVDPKTEIFLEVYAEPKKIIPEESGEIADKDTEEIRESADAERHSVRKYSLGKSLYKTVLFPGLGFAGMDQSRFHLAKGITGYGLIASSIVLNRLAYNNRANYEASEVSAERDNYHKIYVRQDQISKVCAYSAIGIWTVEIVWLLIDINARNKLSDNLPIHMAPGYDPLLSAPTLCLSYQF